MNQDIQNLVQAALECSYFIEPSAPGLTFDEIQEIAGRAGHLPGEISDSVSHLRLSYGSKQRAILDQHAFIDWKFYFPEEPDYRNFDALDFVIKELNQRMREHGFAHAQIERSLLTERAVAAGILEHDVKLAITYLLGAEHIVEQNTVLRFPGAYATPPRPLPSTQKRQHGQVHRKPHRAKAYPMVQDVIARRSDGRSPSVEPLKSFAHQLEKLGYGHFRLWWTQTATEMSLCDPVQAPTAITVLAAALVEGVLTFVVKHARSQDLPPFRSNDFDRLPRSWKIDDLVNSAATGGAHAILDPATKSLAQILIVNRQRIHAGRMLTDYPSGVPDIKSDEVRQAKVTADQVVRRVLDWLERHPPKEST